MRRTGEFLFGRSHARLAFSGGGVEYGRSRTRSAEKARRFRSGLSLGNVVAFVSTAALGFVAGDSLAYLLMRSISN